MNSGGRAWRVPYHVTISLSVYSWPPSLQVAATMCPLRRVTAYLRLSHLVSAEFCERHFDFYGSFLFLFFCLCLYERQPTVVQGSALLFYNCVFLSVSFLSPRAHLHVVGMCGLRQKHKPTELAHSFFKILFLCLVSVVMTLSTVFRSINSPDNSPLSHSVLPVLFLPSQFFQLYISL